MGSIVGIVFSPFAFPDPVGPPFPRPPPVCHLARQDDFRGDSRHGSEVIPQACYSARLRKLCDDIRFHAGAPCIDI